MEEAFTSVHDHDRHPLPESGTPPVPTSNPRTVTTSRDRSVAVGVEGINPDFLAEWEAMDPEEYAFSLRDIPDHILEAEPADDLPEEIRLAWQRADAELLPDPLTDPPGPGLAAHLAEVTDDELRDAGLIDRIVGFERQTAWAAAGQARAVAELASRRVADRGESELAFFVDELALALTCTRYAAWSKLHTALDLVDRLPATLTALAQGRICAARARVVAEGTRALTDDDAARVQDQVLDAAGALTPAKLRDLVARAVAAVDPRDADEKHEDACAARTVRKYPREHGMTGIWALLPADHAAAVWAAVNTHAETSRQPGDDRTADQRRADSLTDLATAYLDGTCPSTIPGSGSGVENGNASGSGSGDSNGDGDGDGDGDGNQQTTGHHGASVDPSATSPAGPHPATGTDPATYSQASTGDGTAVDDHSGIDDDSAADEDYSTVGGTWTEPPAAPGSRPGRSGCALPGGHRPPKVPSWCRVQLKVSADWLLGTSTEAPVLAGHGPLPAEVALRLIAGAGWKRIVYQPLTGALLDVGTTVHDPPAALREHVLVRDGGCTQPTCSNPRVDLDHNVPFPHGPTSAANLRSRCRHHHHLKQHPNWQAHVGEGGRIHWITPTGHAYPEHIPDLRPGATSTIRPDPHIGPDRPRGDATRDDLDDPPPF